jgi:hypothetical protein
MTTSSQVNGLRVSSVLFGIISIVHLVRLFTGPEVFIGSHRLGVIPSLVAVVVFGSLSIWLSRLAGPGCAKAKVGGPAEI